MLSFQKQHSRSRENSAIEKLEARQLLAAAAVNQFTEVNLVSDGSTPAAFTDPNLVNAWGLAASPTGPWWVADNGTGLATTYNGHGQAQAITVTIPGLGGQGSAPTGEVFNGTSAFSITGNGQTAPALFLFATEDGTIAGWNNTVDPANAVTVVDRSAQGAVYKGLAKGTVNGQQVLYATDFHNRTVDVFDSSFNQVTLAGAFTDPRLPAKFSPFGIANINGAIYVSYAKQDAAGHDDLSGPARGFIDVFNTDGTFVKRLVTRGFLNSPWGMVQAPASFGRFANDLLVGNFGNGEINVYDAGTGRHIGRLKNDQGGVLRIDGLWSLAVGNDAAAGSSSTLFFTAGPDDEAGGLFGLIGPTKTSLTA